MVSLQKTAEPIEMPFVLWNRVGPRNHVSNGMRIGVIWRIRMNRSSAATMRPFGQIILTS